MYAVNLNLNEKKCLVIGGGAVGERKISSLIEADAKVTLISPAVTAKLEKLAGTKKINWIKDTYKSGMFKGYFLVIAATNDDKTNLLAIKEAKAAGILVNAPANPSLSDFTLPAVIKRGDLTIAVSTAGISPAFSRFIKEEIAEFLPNDTEEWLKILKSVREELKEKTPNGKDREKFWRKSLNKRVFALLKEGNIKKAEAELRHGFSCNGIES